MPLTSTLFVAGARQDRDDDDNSWRRCRTPSPDFSYHGRFTNIANGMLGSPAAAVCQCSPSNLFVATPPIVWVYVPITDGAPTGFTEYESYDSGARTPSTEVGSGSESPTNPEDTDSEEQLSLEGGLGTTQIEFLPDKEYLDHEESLCWILLDPETSAGSVGHPYACSDACKYFWKSKGCKDGPSCQRCHCCRWVAPRHVCRERARTRQRQRRKAASENRHADQASLHD